MTSGKTIRIIAALFFAGLLAVSCGGSSSDETAATCAKIGVLDGLDLSDDAGMDEALAEMTALRKIAPGDIKDEITLMSEMFEGFADAGDDITKFTAVSASFDEGEVEAAVETLEAWEAANCAIGS